LDLGQVESKQKIPELFYFNGMLARVTRELSPICRVHHFLNKCLICDFHNMTSVKSQVRKM